MLTGGRLPCKSYLGEKVMPRGSKEKYTDKQKRQAEHIEEGYEKKGVSEAEAAKRAWATVNKTSGGGNKKGGSGQKKSAKSKAAARKSSARNAATTRKTGKRQAPTANKSGAKKSTASKKSTGSTNRSKSR